MIGPGQTWSLPREVYILVEVEDDKMFKMILDFYKCFLENKTPWGSDNCAWKEGVTQERINICPEQNLNWDLKAEKHIGKQQQQQHISMICFDHRDKKRD